MYLQLQSNCKMRRKRRRKKQDIHDFFMTSFLGDNQFTCSYLAHTYHLFNINKNE